MCSLPLFSSIASNLSDQCCFTNFCPCSEMSKHPTHPPNQPQNPNPRVNCLVVHSSSSKTHWKQVLPPTDLTCNLGCLSRECWTTNSGLSTHLFESLLCFAGQQQMCSDYRGDAPGGVETHPCAWNDQHRQQKQVMKIKQNSSVRCVGANWNWLSWNYSDFRFICASHINLISVIDNFHSRKMSCVSRCFRNSQASL